jgi:hypothetical protein
MRITKRLAIGLAWLTGVLLLVNGVYSWRTGRQLERRLAALRAAGEPTSFADLAPRPVPPDRDAAARLRDLAPQLELFEKQYAEFLTGTPLGKSFLEREERGEPPTEEQAEAIRDILAQSPGLPQALDDASRREEYSSQIDYSVPASRMMDELISSASGQRTAARFLRWKIAVLLAEGKPDEALRQGLVILRLARHYDREPGLVNGLVALAGRHAAADCLNGVLRAGPVSAGARHELSQELLLHEDPERMQHMMSTERAISLTASRNLFSRAWWLPWMARGLQLDVLDYHHRILPILSQPWYRGHDEIDRVNASVAHWTPVSAPLTELLTPAIRAAYDAYHRSGAELRCLRILNELTAYAQAHGREAEGMDDLDLNDTVTLDPFSGEPLKLKRTDEGWIVYSVFSNSTDDGGDFTEQVDWGLGPPGHAR